MIILFLNNYTLGPVMPQWTSYLDSLGLNLTVTHVNHWWCQEGHLARISPVFPKKNPLIYEAYKTLEWGNAWRL